MNSNQLLFWLLMRQRLKKALIVLKTGWIGISTFYTNCVIQKFSHQTFDKELDYKNCLMHLCSENI